MSKLKVTATRDGFRRAGRAWPAAGVVIDTKDFTSAQIAALKGEPMLEVSEAPAENGAKPADGSKSKK